MCVIIYKPKNATVSNKTLKQCWERNDHGAGLMYADGGKLVVYKGIMKFKKFMNVYEKVKEKSVVIHMRLASQGTVRKNNTHPFFVNDNLAVCHNGTLSGDLIDEEGLIHPNKTDTQIFVDKVLKKLPVDFLLNKTIVELIKGYCGGSVFCFLDRDGRVSIVGDDSDAVVVNKVWFSNDHWKTMGSWDYSKYFQQINTSYTSPLPAHYQRAGWRPNPVAPSYKSPTYVYGDE